MHNVHILVWFGCLSQVNGCTAWTQTPRESKDFYSQGIGSFHQRTSCVICKWHCGLFQVQFWISKMKAVITNYHFLICFKICSQVHCAFLFMTLIPLEFYLLILQCWISWICRICTLHIEWLTLRLTVLTVYMYYCASPNSWNFYLLTIALLSLIWYFWYTAAQHKTCHKKKILFQHTFIAILQRKTFSLGMVYLSKRKHGDVSNILDMTVQSLWLTLSLCLSLSHSHIEHVTQISYYIHNLRLSIMRFCLFRIQFFVDSILWEHLNIFL